MTSLTYRDSGVDIDAGDAFVDGISVAVAKTKRPEVVSHLGGYAGLFALDLSKYPQPLIVSTTDGVGTKLKLAFEMKSFGSIGQDLVGMCVNDLVCCGAEPLFFLDYFATGLLEVGTAQVVVEGIAKALQSVNCTLIGGETAEMPGFYAKGEFDLAGFAVGVVNKDKVVDGQQIEPGDVLIGLASSGPHSNGYSLIRKIIEVAGLDLNKKYEGFSKSLGEELLTPTRLYVNAILGIREKLTIKGIAHITGSGLLENVPRFLPDNIKAIFSKSKINTPPIFKALQKWGQVDEAEMWRVFNMGVGMVICVEPSIVDEALKQLSTLGFEASVIGKTFARTANEAQAELEV